MGRFRSSVVRLLKRTRMIGMARHLRAAFTPANRQQHHLMVEFYRRFIKPGDVVFDVGANVGNRSVVFLELGARVVAVEPQDKCGRELERRFGSNPAFTLVRDALGESEGEAELLVSDESTVSSMAKDWVETVKSTGRFGETEWQKVQKVHTTTLDSLVARHGSPAFCKIDVEGYEPVVLSGLSKKIGAISFEFTPEFFSGTTRCVEHLSRIGYREFNFSLGESMALELPVWLDGPEILRSLSRVPASAFGDVYAK